MRSRIFLKLILSFALIIVVATVVMDFAITRAWEHDYIANTRRAMEQNVQLLSERVNDGKIPLNQITAETEKATSSRVTIIQDDGTVLVDSNANASEMENHATRPEFISALKGQLGSSIRHSHTLDVDFLYVAAPTNSGGVRLAYPLHEINAATRRIHLTLFRCSLAAFALALVLAFISAHAIARRVDRILHFADEIADGRLSARLADHSNDELGHVAFALNRTAERLQQSFEQVERSHRDLAAVLNSMQEGVIAVGPDLRVLWSNNRLLSLLSGRVRLGQPVAETLRDPGVLDALERAVKNSEAVTARADSAVPGRIMSVTAAPLPNRGAVAVLFDITDFERVEKTRRDFIANVSHELRTPLTSVQGYSETLLEGNPSAETSREFLEVIRKNATRMVRLTEDLLTLAKVESGETKPKIQTISASELLSDAERYWKETRREPELQAEVKPNSTQSVHADRDAILQVFSNLIENACKYASSGGRIEIGSHDIEGYVSFYVRDFGPGIPPEHLPRLFERFYRVDRVRSRETGGTGLGLAICKHIIRVHRGTIRAESELGKGSTFVFTLPIA